MEVNVQPHAPAALDPGRKPGTHWIRGWVDPRTVLDNLENRKKYLSSLSKFESRIVYPVACPLHWLRHSSYSTGRNPCFPPHWIRLRCENHRISRLKPTGEGSVRGVVYRKEIGYLVPKASGNSMSLGITIQTIDTCLETASVLHKRGTGRPHVSDENVEGTCLCLQSLPRRKKLRFDLQKAGFLSTAVATETFEFVCLKLASVVCNCATKYIRT
jgi:hypothetical protein